MMSGAPQDRTIQIGEIKTRYWAGGSQSSPVVLIHSLGCHVEDWQANFEALAAHHRMLEKAGAFNALLLAFLDDPADGEVRQQEDRSYT